MRRPTGRSCGANGFGALFAAAALGLLGGASVADPSPASYTVVHHPVSTRVAAAQAAFDRGLTLVYAYEEVEGRRAFREAARLDPTLAMAWWGVALAYGPDINAPPERDATRFAAQALARARKLAARGARSDERDYIEALAARYTRDQNPDFDALALAYRDRMRDLVAKYPSDPDAAALFAEAAMDLHPWRLWNADGTPADGTLELVNVIETALRSHPDHVGLMHFYIHAVEASPAPGRALAAARRLAALPFEPAAAHLVHMPAHTFLRVGDWDAAVHANTHAVHESLAFANRKSPVTGHACAHCLGFLAYAYSVEGNLAGAERAATELSDMGKGSGALIEVLARFGRASELLALPAPALPADATESDRHGLLALWHYGRGVAEVIAGDLLAARQELERLRAEALLVPPVHDLPTDRPALIATYEYLDAAPDQMERELAIELLTARIARAAGDGAAALERLRTAVEIQDRAQYTEPPAWLYPVRETLAAALADAGRHEEAIRVLRECLARMPHDPRALVRLQAELVATGQVAEAAGLEAEVAAARARADRPLADD